MSHMCSFSQTAAMLGWQVRMNRQELAAPPSRREKMLHLPVRSDLGKVPGIMWIYIPIHKAERGVCSPSRRRWVFHQGSLHEASPLADDFKIHCQCINRSDRFCLKGISTAGVLLFVISRVDESKAWCLGSQDLTGFCASREISSSCCISPAATELHSCLG